MIVAILATALLFGTETSARLVQDGDQTTTADTSAAAEPDSFGRDLLQVVGQTASGKECICDAKDQSEALINGLIGNLELQDRIVGGREVQPFRYPFVVNLARFGLLEFCGGSLIAPDVVLTAAHCDKSSTSIWIGRHDLRNRRESFEQRQVIDKAYPGTRWDPNTNDNDIMLLHLEAPVDPKYTPVLLDDGIFTEDVEASGARVTAMGWGTTEWQGRRSSVLREVTVTGFPREQCNDPRMYDGLITPNMLCAANFGKDSCQGDSGGPLVVSKEEQDLLGIPGLNSGEEVQVGVVSWGVRCAALQVELDPRSGIELQSGFPGVYVRLANYKNFIKETLETWGSEPPRFVSEQ